MKFYRRLNGTWHGWALLVLFAPILFHMFEHVTQAVQVYALDTHRADALGFLGMWMADLIRGETVHFGFAAYTLLAMLLLGGPFVGLARSFGILALAVQSWHLFEHSLLVIQGQTGSFFFGAEGPTSLAQLLVPRVELHFAYNAVVFSVIVIAVLLHAYPPRGETALPRCGCARAAVAGMETVVA